MRVRGVRGATTATANTRVAICSATQELLRQLIAVNEISTEEIASAFFTVTGDLDAGYPALAAREMGWVFVPLLCALEIPVPGGLARCVRVLLHVNTEKTQEQIRHVYLREAVALRPAFAALPEAASAPITSQGDPE
jgi:chorismate mutase